MSTTLNQSSKYNVTEIEVNSFSDLFVEANGFMGGGLGYGVVFVVWLISLTLFAEYPNTDALKASSFTAWLTSILFSVFGVVPASFPMALFLAVAGITAYQEVSGR